MLAIPQLSVVPLSTSLNVMVVEPLSLMTTVKSFTLIVGKMLSTIFTNCVAVDVFPEPSTTVQVTVVNPRGKIAGASFDTVATEQLSEVTGAPRFTPIASQAKFGAIVTFAGGTITGFVLSPMNTVIGNDVAEHPLAFVTVTV